MRSAVRPRWPVWHQAVLATCLIVLVAAGAPAAAKAITLQQSASRVAAVLVSPAPGSTLSGPTVAFSWTNGTGVSSYRLEIGSSQGASDLFGTSFPAGTTSATASNLPTDGRRLYVRLTSLFPGWEQGDPIARWDTISGWRGNYGRYNGPFTVYYNDGRVGSEDDLNEFGYTYQCVELVQRYFYLKRWVSQPVWTRRGVAVPRATLMPDYNPAGTVNEWQGGIAKPMPGDILVFSSGGGWGADGHVALISTVTSKAVSFVQQNLRWDGRPVAVDQLPLRTQVFTLGSKKIKHYSIGGASKSGVIYPPVKAWIHATKNNRSLMARPVRLAPPATFSDYQYQSAPSSTVITIDPSAWRACALGETDPSGLVCSWWDMWGPIYEGNPAIAAWGATHTHAYGGKTGRFWYAFHLDRQPTQPVSVCARMSSDFPGYTAPSDGYSDVRLLVNFYQYGYQRVMPDNGSGSLYCWTVNSGDLWAGWNSVGFAIDCGSQYQNGLAIYDKAVAAGYADSPIQVILGQ